MPWRSSTAAAPFFIESSAAELINQPAASPLRSRYNEFFDCFGVNRRQVATYEQRVRNLPGDKRGFIDLFWPGTLIVEQKSAGLDLKKASNQALDYYDWLLEKDRPRYLL